MSTVRDTQETRTGRGAKTKDEGPDVPGVWSAYGVLLQYLRKRAGLNQQQLGDAIGYSLEQVASVEQGRRPAKAAFTVAAERVLEAGGVLDALQGEVDRAKLPNQEQLQRLGGWQLRGGGCQRGRRVRTGL